MHHRGLGHVLRTRSIGGHEAVPNSRPYMALLLKDGKAWCGGFLVADQWVASAAHCLHGMKSEEFSVVLGAHSIYKDDSFKEVFKIQSYFLHSEFKEDPRQNDILLMKLNEKVTISPAVKTIGFQRVNQDVSPGTMCLVPGWGSTSSSGRKPEKLQEVEVPIISRTVCNGRRDHDGNVNENMLCAGGLRKDACEGDSGGPLVCNGIVEGIVSFGPSVCGGKKSGVYVRISAYVDWIDSIMANNS